MGEAYDRTGHMLGSAVGDTKREVFDKLIKEHGDNAAEIRIRSFHRSGDAESHVGAGASAEMPRYRSHKDVWALKIERIEYDSVRAQAEGRETDGSAMIVPADAGYAPFKVDSAYLRKHDPHFGGYYVVYADGYKSFSPAKAFEDGYTRL